MIWNMYAISGGKDSVAMLLKALEEEPEQVHDIYNIVVKATPTMSAEFPENTEYLHRLDEYIQKVYGKHINFVESALSFEEYFYREVQFGKNAGRIYGWPYTIGAWCNTRLKVNTMKRYEAARREEQGVIRVNVGIAVDEPVRIERMRTEGKFMPLVDMNITESECREYVINRGLYNDYYNRGGSRCGCWFCPKQRLDSLKRVKYGYPDLWKVMLKWDLDSPISFKPKETLHQIDARI